MAKAIGSRIFKSGILGKQAIMVSAPSDRNLGYWQKLGVLTTNDNLQVINHSEIVFIAVKPQYFDDMIRDLKNAGTKLTANKCFVSFMVGKTIRIVKQKLAEITSDVSLLEVIKVMPNTPAMSGAGCTVICHEGKKGEQFENVSNMMKLTGICEEIPESLMNACGALSGSGPAYLYMVIEALADGGVKQGIPRALAYRLAAQTMVGAGKMVLDSGLHPGVLKDEVCSPGGTTITAVHQLEKSGVRAAFIDAIQAAVERSNQLGS
ncbi:pyrroline-5-carboxylate reductase [Nesidiocoris tenuis]|nr:pyrroline-5-carboxylate reductase [Nesidiocoris tenuis]